MFSIELKYDFQVPTTVNCIWVIDVMGTYFQRSTTMNKYFQIIITMVFTMLLTSTVNAGMFSKPVEKLTPEHFRMRAELVAFETPVVKQKYAMINMVVNEAYNLFPDRVEDIKQIGIAIATEEIAKVVEKIKMVKDLDMEVFIEKTDKCARDENNNGYVLTSDWKSYVDYITVVTGSYGVSIQEGTTTQSIENLKADEYRQRILQGLGLNDKRMF